ncbi:MAG: glycosyltransferase family 4 protein [Bacteroidetes bacterium]|nr:glycosyltransferase family 4 protein [Bacteroidota bacterium]
MKILILCNKSPFPPKEGGPIAMNMIIEGLSAADHQVKVLAVNSGKFNISRSEIPEDYIEKTGLELIDVDLRIKPFPALVNLLMQRSYHVQRFKSGRFRTRLKEILERETFDVVQFEMLFMSVYLDTVRKYSMAKTVLHAHNIEHLIWERIAVAARNPLRKAYLIHLAKTLKAYELSVINRFDGLCAITGKDLDFFIDHGCKIPATDIPFGIDPGSYPAGNDKADHSNSLFSIGAMNWIPNQEGIRWFLQNVWPDIHQQFPSLKYYIAGREMPEWLTLSNYPNVIVVGEVDDAKAFIGSGGIMIVPLFSGSGIRIKIIEGMALGKPVISTTIGAEGINYTRGENIMIADEPCEFFEMISNCAESQNFCKRIGTNAKKLVEIQYNREHIISKLIAFYQKIGV